MTAGTDEPHHLSPIDFLRTRSLTNVVQAEIERMIVDGELQPGERVNENALAQKLGVSRGPIREACSALTAMGLIAIIPNRGFFVRVLSDEEAADLGEARAGIFGYIGFLLARRITDEQLEQLNELTARMDEAAQTGKAKVYYPINLEFHDTIIRMCGNARLAQVYQGMVRELHIHRYRGLQDGEELVISNAEHKAMVSALASRRPDRAFEAFSDHVQKGLVRNFRVRKDHPELNRQFDGEAGGPGAASVRRLTR
jgi:DNA-binding GntR family transcriptional regulator